MSTTKHFAVIGHPIKHSRSPVMHRHNFESMDIDATYVPLDIAPEHLMHIREIAEEKNLSGFNVTIPHKTNIMQYLDEIDETAMMMGAVNTVHITDQGWKGYNTDGQGFVDGLNEAFNMDLNNQNVMIIGAGGAAMAISFAFIKAGADVYVANRNSARFNDWKFAVNQLTLNDIKRVQNQMNIIVNTTPLGMEGFDYVELLDYQLLNQDIIIADIIYTPAVTQFLKQALDNNNKIINGLPMFVNQGAASFEIWTGLRADKQAMTAAVIKSLN